MWWKVRAPMTSLSPRDRGGARARASLPPSGSSLTSSFTSSPPSSLPLPSSLSLPPPSSLPPSLRNSNGLPQFHAEFPTKQTVSLQVSGHSSGMEVCHTLPQCCHGVATLLWSIIIVVALCVVSEVVSCVMLSQHGSPCQDSSEGKLVLLCYTDVVWGVSTSRGQCRNSAAHVACRVSARVSMP